MIRTYKLTGLLVTSLLLAACAVGTAQPPAKDGKEPPKGGRGPGGPGGPGGFGPGGFGGGRTAPGTILSTFIQTSLKMTDDQKKQLADLQKEVDDKLEKILTDDQKKQLKEMRDNAGRGFGRPGPGGPGGPGAVPPKKKDD